LDRVLSADYIILGPQTHPIFGIPNDMGDSVSPAQGGGLWTFSTWGIVFGPLELNPGKELTRVGRVCLTLVRTTQYQMKDLMVRDPMISLNNELREVG
jgi:hypothetical protein